MTVVATGAPAIGESELVFDFNEPFLYEGGNLAIEALVIEAGAYSFKDYFLGVSTTEYVSYAHFNDLGWESHVYKFLPMATFGYVKEDTPQPEWEIGDVNHDNAVDVSDVTALITYVLNGSADNFYETEGNVNGESGIDVSDITALISIVLGTN